MGFCYREDCLVPSRSGCFSLRKKKCNRIENFINDSFIYSLYSIKVQKSMFISTSHSEQCFPLFSVKMS